MAVVWPGFLLIVLFAAWMLRQHLSQPNLTNAVLYPDAARSIQSFTLVDFDNRVFDNNRLLGKWSFVFFGYTHCPDICPLTLQTLDRAADLMKKQNDADVQFIFVSVDPRRDNTAHLKNYVTYFNPNFLGISGDRRELSAFSKALDAPFGITDNADSKSYAMAHSGQIFLISPKAERYALLPQPHRPGDIIQDFLVIRSYYYKQEV